MKMLNDEVNVSRVEQGLFCLLFLYFVGKMVFFALNIHSQVFPDEASWFGMVELFSRSYLPPVDSPESYPLGLVTHIPNLYFLLMGKFLNLNPFPGSDLIFMRLINAGMGGVSLFFSWRLFGLLLPNAWGRILALVMLANTMMFTFIAGAVNYDNLSTLFAVLSLYFLVLFRRQRRLGDLLWLVVLLLAGILTKNVFLPYGVGLFIVLLAGEWQEIVSGLRWWKNVHFASVRDYGKLFVIFLLLGASLNLYLGNKIRYGHLLPAMDQVLTVENCLQNRLFTRGYATQQFKNGKLPMLEAQRLALQVRDPGDRAFAMQLLRSASLEKSKAKATRKGRLAYTGEWLEFMTARLYGVAAHLSLYKSDRWHWGYYGIYLLASVLLLYRFFKDGLDPFAGLLFIFFFYVVILMQVVNYGGYKGSGFVGLALTGRYLFPVIVPFYILVAHGLMSRMPGWWQWALGISVSGFFVYSEFPWFIQNITPAWYF